MKKILFITLFFISITSFSQVRYISNTAGENIITCLSTDTKPTVPANEADILFELNTAKIYYNNAGVWTCASCITYSSITGKVDLTTQAANIGTTTLYAVPAAGFYRVSIYITETQIATTSSTMPSTTISYTDGNSGTNVHSTVTTATAATNSLTTSFAQASYVLYAKTGTNINYSTAGYVSSGATPMQYALRIRIEAL